jgi:transcriptional antiterminator RfaH
VRITDGPFAELQAIYLRMEGEARVVVLLNFLQREQQVKLPLSKIARF